MSSSVMRGLSAVLFGFALATVPATMSLAQAPAAPAAAAAPTTQAFPTPEAAADALTDAVRKNDRAALAKLWGNDWRDFAPGSDEAIEQRRKAYVAA